MSAHSLLELRQLTVTIGSTNICKDLSLQIAAENCWGILGVNGAGKTTLLHTLAGLHDPDSGAVYYQNKPLEQLSVKEKARHLGVLFQRESLAFPVTVLEAVLAGRHPHLGYWGWETSRDLDIARAAIDQVAMTPLNDRLSNTLSGGELQRVAIATLLTQAPRIALLDEPSNHLDLGQQIKMLQVLKKQFSNEQQAIVMVLHDINLALRFCDHFLLLQGNGQWLAGPTHEIATAENLSSLYGHPLSMIEGPHGPTLLPL